MTTVNHGGGSTGAGKLNILSKQKMICFYSKCAFFL